MSYYGVMIFKFKNRFYRFCICIFVLLNAVNLAFGQDDNGWNATLKRVNNNQNISNVEFRNNNISTDSRGFGSESVGLNILYGERYAQLIKREKDISKGRLYYFEIGADDGFSIGNNNHSPDGNLLERRYWGGSTSKKILHGSTRRVLIYLDRGDNLVVNYFNRTWGDSFLKISNFTKIEPKISEEGDKCIENNYKLFVDRANHFEIPLDPPSNSSDYRERLGDRKEKPLWINIDTNGKGIGEDEKYVYGNKSEYVWHIQKIGGCKILVSDNVLGEFKKHSFEKMLESSNNCKFVEKKGRYEVTLERKVTTLNGTVHSVFSEKMFVDYDGYPQIKDAENMKEVELCLPKINRAYMGGDVLNIEGDFVLERGDKTLDVEIINSESQCCESKEISWSLWNGAVKITEGKGLPSEKGLKLANQSNEDLKYTMKYELKCKGKVVSSANREIILKARPKLELIH